MDNICHTLVGAICGEAGLKRRTRFGFATLMIAANLPDVDVAVFATGTPSVAFRRGVTHGVVAQMVLPLILALSVWAIARRRRDSSGPPTHLGWLLAVSYIGVLSHVALDLTNNYGVRLLMPFSPRWFYGDTLFIVDPWMWAVMGLGVWLARRANSARPARLALAATCLYVLAMFAGATAARARVSNAFESAYGAVPASLMVGPRPVTPFTRDVIADAGDHYVTGTFSWLPPSIHFDAAPTPKNADAPEVAEARRDPGVQAFLVWSRFPRWMVMRHADGATVSVADMRFGAIRRVVGRGFQAETVVPR